MADRSAVTDGSCSAIDVEAARDPPKWTQNGGAVRRRQCYPEDDGTVAPIDSSTPCSRREIFCVRHRWLILLGLLLTALTAGHALWHGSALGWYLGRASNSVYLYLTPYYRGREEATDPSPRCCTGVACLTADRRRYAVVTTLRTDQYLGLTQALACSLRASNPGLPLIVMTVNGDLEPETLTAVARVAELRFVKEFYIANANSPRFGLNWAKLRGWEFTDLDAVLMLDSDMVVDGDLSWIFSLPTDFATVLDADKLRALPKFSPMGMGQGGFLFFRPCAAVARHMMRLTLSDPALQYRYHDAEQTFLDWYFKYTRWALPQEYNGLVGRPHTVAIGGRNLTRGGVVPIVRHFSGPHKPWAENLAACEAAMQP